MSRCSRFLGALVLVACAEKSIEVAPAAVGACARQETGCACAPGSSPVACFEPDKLGPDGEVLCTEGTRRCESGRWSECRDVRSYPADARARARGTALIDPNSSPRTCSICDVQCFEVTDPLLSVDAGADSSVTYAPGGGLTLAEGVAGPVGGPSGPVRLGCVGLDDCCDTLIAVPSLRSACQAANSGDDAQCDDAHRLFCSDVVLPAASVPCVAGANPLDTDCDNIPDLVDQCTPADYSAAACGGRFLPLPSPNNNPAIFHVLDQGRSANDPLQIEFKLRNADVYFLLDTSDTMSEERDELVGSLISSRVVDCALLKNCCAPLSGSAKTKCDDRVEDDIQSACLADQAKYCTSPAQTDCADSDGDGLPNDEHKTEGVVGAVRCLVGSSWFGAGTFRELPFADGVNYITTGAKDGDGFQDRGNQDEWAFRHYVDMTSDVDKVRDTVQLFQMDGNYDFPESAVIALYSLVTGEGHSFGHLSPSIPRRTGFAAGCPGYAFGYPCFRAQSVPVIILFTDDPMNNGPGAYNPSGFSGETEPVYDKNYTANGWLPSEGYVRYVPGIAEDFNVTGALGDVYKRFVIAAGDTRDMAADLSGAEAGCGAADGAPDAMMQFDMTGTEKVQFALNVALDPDYSDAEVANGPTPATEFPAVISVYDSDQNLIDCKTVCPKVVPWGCTAANASCSTDGECCSGDCRFGKCDSPDPAGLDLCSSGELVPSFTTSGPLSPGTYFVSVKGRREKEKGFFELQVGDPKNGIKSGVYTPPKWSTVSNAIVASGAKVLPVLSCGRSWSGSERCTGAIDQARVLAEDSGAIDPVTKDGLVGFIDPDGSGLGSTLVMSVRDLANHLSMDVTLKPSEDLDPNPFQIDIQKCTDKTDPVQLAACKAWTVGCDVGVAAGKQTIRDCSPGSTPRFVVHIENPIAAPVPDNPADPFGGYHFSLQLLGNNQALIDEIPVYIIPTDRNTLMPPVPPYQDSGSYEQLIFGKGCAYNAVEGEADGQDACSDRLDNDGDMLVDGKDPDCFLGTCLDAKDNDKDGLTDGMDGSCEVTAQQEWTDLFFNADLPFGTSIGLDACTVSSTAELKDCSYTHVATVRSLMKSCSVHGDCAGIDLGAGAVDGYCSSGGQCQHIDPQKLGRDCDDDSDCDNGTLNGKVIASSCDLGAGKCVYASQPVDLGSGLPAESRSLPYLQLKITLNANAASDAAPTLFDWSAQYLCRSSR